MQTTNRCPKCGSTKYVKHGKIKNKQRYKCKECRYHFTVFKIGKKIERELVVRAIQLYLEGMGFRAIERILGVSHVSVMNWVEKLGKSIEQMRKNYPTEFKVVEMDELCSYIKERETKHRASALIVKIENKFLVFM